MSTQESPWRCRLCERSNPPRALACEACGYDSPAVRRAAAQSKKAEKGGPLGWLARVINFVRR